MESLSRPPHRKKHASFASFSTKTPYDDVLVSGRGVKSKPFGAHEYAEIFAGSSSSIPVLDLPELDERVGSAGGFTSKLDYSSIFGGLREDDLVVPYEELFDAAKKTKSSSGQTFVPSDPELHTQESGSIHSGKTEQTSGGSADQLVNGVKQQFNLAFNKTSQSNNDPSKGKTHIAQLNAVPGFTHFIDGADRLLKTEDDRSMRMLKRDVSRTWSFNVDVEAVTARGSSRIDLESHDKSSNMTESNLKPHISDVLPPSNRPYNIREHDSLKGSRPSNFPTKEDSSGKKADVSLPSLFRDEIDENSVAAVSAAALKRAMDQAQESIRLAKMIREKKKEVLPNGSKTRPEGRLTLKETKGSGTVMENSSKWRNYSKTHQSLDPRFPGFKELNEKVGSLPNQIVNRSNSVKNEFENRRDNEETAKGRGEEFKGVGENLFTSCSQFETLLDIDKVELKLQEKNIQSHLEYTQIDTNNNLIFSMNKLPLNHQEVGAAQKTSEQREVFVHFTEVPEHIAEVDRTGCSSETTQKLENVVVEVMEHGVLKLDPTQATENDTEFDEKAHNVPHSTVVKENVGEAGSNLRIIQENQVKDKSLNDVTHERGPCELKIEEREEVIGVEHLKLPGSNFDKFINDQLNMNEKDVIVQENDIIDQTRDAVELEEMVNIFASVSECGENGDRNGISWDEEERLKGACAKFETKEQLKEGVDKVTDEVGPKVFLGMEAVEVSFNGVNEPENVSMAPNYYYDKNSRGISSGPEQNQSYESCMGTSKNETTETKLTEANNCTEFLKGRVSSGPEEADILGGSEKSGEILCKQGFPAPFPETNSEAVDDRSYDSSILSDIQSHNGSSIFNPAEESHDMNLDDGSKETGSVPTVIETCSVSDSGMKAEELFQFEEKDVCKTDSSCKNEAVDDRSYYSSSIFSDIQSHNGSSIFNPAEESHDMNLDDGSKESDSVPTVIETCSLSDSGMKAEKLFQFEDNDVCRTDSLCKNASDTDLVGKNSPYAFEVFSFDHKMETIGGVSKNFEETLPNDTIYYSPDHQSVHRTEEDKLTDVELASEQTSVSDGISVSSSIPENADVFPVHECAENTKNEASDKEEVEDIDINADNFTDVELVSERTSESDGISVSSSIPENTVVFPVYECAENTKNETSDKEKVEDIDISTDKINLVLDEIVYSEECGEDVHSQIPSQPKGMHDPLESERSVETGQSFKKTNECINDTSTMGEKCTKENLPNFDKEDQKQRIEAIKKGRAREKDRLAVERAMREARERAFAEARERAERAAVERVASEVRQKVMAEAQEKVEKTATVTKQTADKASAQAKLRSERAAVERATVEARDRALEKAMSQKTTTEVRAHADRYTTERSINNGLKHSFSSSDLEKFDGTSNESAQRRKARLERHQRITERAAKALAEKSMRDLLAQKEQAERNRLADSLDADIKRWVTGKEGNLRALLSTLQYILGPNSGWQPISLTEILTTVAVKKAYRKATLYVHPDKLQQRGASIQQKYICEKVFYLLKDAWNKFNSEER